MGRIERLFVILFAVILLFSLSHSHDLVVAQPQGPRTEDLIIRYYPNIEQVYTALKNGSIDICAYELTSDLYQDAITDANIAIVPVGDYGMYELDINNNVRKDWIASTD